MTDDLPQGAVAVIGMACRMPGAASVDEFWRNLRSGTESITFFDAEALEAAGVSAKTRDDPNYVPAKGVLPGGDCFDAGFFGFSPREAALMDPQQRVFLECAWTALEHAGIVPRDVAGPIGVFAGSILSTYLLQNVWPNRALVESAGIFQTALGNDPTFLATRASYLFDLHGPSMSVGTACSTSLMAVHLACQSLLARESDVALAGGVSIHLPLAAGYRYEEGGILSPDGHCRPFDAGGRGTVSSDGVGVVVLKRLEDAVADGDMIHAVVRGSASNNDGAGKVGFTAPSVGAQAAVIGEALAMAGVAPDSIAMVEAHAAGTLLGDPIEVAALAEAFAGAATRKSCALGSVKSNIGHVDAAAGIAGFIKAVLALAHREIPATLHFERANAQIDFAKTPFFVNNALLSLKDRAGPLRAGVSSFGIGGTNVHVVLEESPAREHGAKSNAAPYEVLMLSARSADALEAATDRLADHLEENPDLDLAGVGVTLRRGRKAFEHRRFLVAANRGQAIAALRARDPQALVTGEAAKARPSLTFMFPGLGDHYPGMGWELYCAEPVFRAAVDRCAGLLHAHLDGDIRDHLYPGRDWSNPLAPVAAATDGNLDLRAMLGRGKASASDRPEIAQPAIFVTEIALAELLRHWGLVPEAMIGHSIGEFAAATVSGVFSLPDALKIVATRARLIQTLAAPGVMLAVSAGEAKLRPLLPDGVSLAALNAASLSVASGPAEGIAALESRLREAGIEAQRLRSTHAYHSAMMEKLVAPLTAALASVTLNAPRIPYMSCVTGTWITQAEATDPAYWARHLCRTVRFQPGLSELLADPSRVLLEVGPGQSLTSHAVAERGRIGRAQPVIPAMRWSYGRQSEIATLLRAVGMAWTAGVVPDMTRFLARPGARRVPLPTYPFARQRYWIDPPASNSVPTASAGLKNPNVDEWFYLPYWKPTLPGHAAASAPCADWLIIADAHGVGDELAARLRRRGANATVIACSDDYAAALRDPAPRRVVHLGGLTQHDPAPLTTARFAAAQETGFHSLMRLVQALSAQGIASDTHLTIVANGLCDVTGNEHLSPEKATLLGPAMVAAQEYPGLVCRWIDTDIAPDDRREDLVSQLLAEIAGGQAEPAIAYRHGRRWTQAYEKVTLAAPEQPPFRREGVYMLTGGLGGVGLVMARHLAKTYQARLALVGRSAFPPNAQWTSWLAAHPPDDPIGLKIRQLQTLEEMGAEVLVLRADVSDAAAMRDALAQVDARFGALHGVIHGAGVVGLEAFREISRTGPADADAQFAAKVRGVLVLDEVLRGRTPDFCLLMSSLSAVLGGLGFAAYSAGNLFMDAFARAKARDAGTRWISVDWDSWQLADVHPVIAGLGATVSEFVMAPDEGAGACERILAQGIRGQIVVSSGDLHGRLRQWIEGRGRDAAKVPTEQAHARPNLRSTFAPPRGQLEIALAEIWSELFNVEPIGVNDNFFELGGHSLLATQLNARLSSRLHVEMSLATLLQAPTIAELALAIVGAQAVNADPDLLERMLAEVGELSGAEIARVLGEGEMAVGP